MNPAPMLTSNRRDAYPTQTARPVWLPTLPSHRPTRSACVTSFPQFPATQSKKMVYHHTRNNIGSRILRHNAPSAPPLPGPSVERPLRLPCPHSWGHAFLGGCQSERSSSCAPPRQGHGPDPPAPSARLRHFICDTLNLPRVPARVSEALVLRTYPFKEADLVVSFLTRDQGKLRGVAKRARRPKSTFGSGLERLSHVRMAYFQRESHELVNLDSCELIRSQFDLVTDYQASIALDFFAEASELLLPSAEPGEKFFCLLVAVLESLRPAGGQDSGQAGRVWRAVTYFSLWAVRLSGWLPELHVCLGCGNLLDDPESPQRAFFSRDRPGLICGHCRRTSGAGISWELSPESREIAGQILRRPVAQLGETTWTQS